MFVVETIPRVFGLLWRAINMNFFPTVRLYFSFLFLIQFSNCSNKILLVPPWGFSYYSKLKTTAQPVCQQRPHLGANRDPRRLTKHSLRPNEKKVKFSSHPVECEDMIGNDIPHSPSDDSQQGSIPPSSPLTGSDDGSSNGENKKETVTFPKTLEEFKYEFNEKGQLRHTETNKPFEFHVSDDSSYNQQHYEALGEIITEHVYNLLEKAGLEKIHIPIDCNDSEPQSFIFHTKDALENEEKLLLLVHGSGVVKAGQWARRLIINDCLETGSQLPFIERAVDEGYGVLVLNTNLNTVDGQKIRENGNPTQHMLYVWRNFVQKARAKHVAFVSHSYGGIVTVKAAIENPDFQSRVFAVAFTDSIHNDYVNDDLEKFFQEKSQNWVSSDEPLDTKIPSHSCITPKVSAGHSVHEMTSSSSIESIFAFLKQKYKEITKNQSM